MKSVVTLLFSMLLLSNADQHGPRHANAKSHSQSRKQSEVRSVRRFVQSFYDWYTSLPERADARLLTIKDKGSLLSSELRQALWDDWYRRELTPGFLIGPDF